MPLGKGGSSFGYDGTTLGLSNGNLYVINDAHTHATQYLKLDGSNANATINIGSQALTTLGNLTCNTLNYTSLNPAIPATAPGGETTNVQYNNAGAFGGNASLTYDGSGTLTVATKIVASRITAPADSTAAFNIYQSDGTTPAMIIDSINDRIGLGKGALNPAYTWHFRQSAGPMAVFQTTTVTNMVSVVLYNSSTYGLSFSMYGASYAGAYAAYGLNYANLALMRLGPSCTALIIETYDLKPICFGTNATERARFLSTGQFGLGVTAPSAILHLKAGTTAASSAPLKFTSGTSLTVAAAGAMEFTTDDLFFTITTGPARKRLLMADPVAGLTTTRIPYATTNGRLTDSANLTTDGTSLTLGAGSNIVLDSGTGTKIGTATTQLLGFYNATPVDQRATVADAATQDLTGTDTVDKTKLEADLTSCKNAINAIIDRIQELGLMA
jgi:hypothetical protein